MLEMIVAVAAAVPPVCAAIAAILNLRKRSASSDPDQVWTGRTRPPPPPLPTVPSPVAPGWYVGHGQEANTWDSARAVPRAPAVASTPSPGVRNRWWQAGQEHTVEQSGRR
jgi:hypothetical protein